MVMRILLRERNGESYTIGLDLELLINADGFYFGAGVNQIMLGKPEILDWSCYSYHFNASG
jgi:hypothetical protein